MAKTRVLVVEDERIVALHLKQRLIKLGYDVTAVVTAGVQALEQIATAPPDVVLMDIHIDPGIDGIETASRIPAELFLPVIYLTAYSEERTLERARVTQPYGYLLKPFSERELHATIQMALERRRANLAIWASEQRLETLVEERTAALQAAGAKLEAEAAERLKIEEALGEARKMEAIGQLTGGVAHDFNNLLTIIAGSLDLIREAPGNAAKVAELAASGLTAVQRCDRLIKQLLMFARRQPLNPAIVGINRLIDEFAPLTHVLGASQIDLVSRLRPDVQFCRIDQTQFERALLNLVMNARDAIEGHGRITIETRNQELGSETRLDGPDIAPGRYVVVSVTDTGRGIPSDVLPRVFEPFFTTKSVGNGSGLGLSQVYGFATESGGGVQIQSTVGRTTVSLYLPCADAPMSQPDTDADRAVVDASGSAAAPARAIGGEIVLIVEDDDVVLELAVDSLKGLGYAVLTARNGEQALGILRSLEPITILFSDIVMPGPLNGVQLAAEARRLRPGLKVLLTSGYGGKALAERGIDDRLPLLEKPYRRHELAAHIQMLLPDDIEPPACSAN